jgi:hypothetical protein
VKIIFESSVLLERRWYPIVDVIMLLVEDSRHALAPETSDSILASEWLKERSIDTRELVRLSITGRSYDDLVDKTSVTLDAHCRRGGRVDFSAFDTRVHPLDAILFLSTPFQVIVENEWYDGGFLLWMAKAVGFDRLVTAYRQGRFVFRHAGGKDVLSRSAAVLSGGVWPRRDAAYERALRLWACVLIDNDARYPGDDPNQAIIAEVTPYVTFVHQLRRRSIESYLPAEKLRRFNPAPEFARKVNALFRLDENQHTHYDMKRGFRDDDGPPSKATYIASPAVTPQEKALYQSVSETDWSELTSGFGRGISRIYVDEQHRPNSNDSHLVDAADKHEMLRLVKAIYERI